MRTVSAVVGCSLLMAGCGRIAFDARTDATAAARSRLVLDRNLPTTQLANFPLPIVLDSTRADLALLTPATFRAFAGSTELHVEVETVNGENPFVAWVRVPMIEPTPIEITIEYGGDPGALHDVWDDTYLFVMHANGGARDSSRYGRAAMAFGVDNVPGPLGGAASFDPALSSYVVVPSLASYAFTNVTLSAWMRMRTPTMTNIYYSAITRQLDDSYSDDFMLAIEPSTLPYGHISTPGGTSPDLAGATVVPTSEWHRLVYTYDGSTQSLWLDTFLQASGAAMGAPLASARPVFLGAGRNAAITPIDVPDQDFVDGELDEIRIETTGRSNAWIIFEARAQDDRVITYGPIERL